MTARTSVRLRLSAALLAVALVAVAAPASALITYKAEDGYLFGAANYHHQHGGDPAFQSVDSGLCPTTGPPLDICVHTRAAAGMDAVNRLYLSAGAQLRRQNASPAVVGQNSALAFASSEIEIFGLDGYVAMAPAAYFYFGLSGTILNTKTDVSVTTQTFAVAHLYAGSGASVQCDEINAQCPPNSVMALRVTSFQPSQHFEITLRSDVAIGAPTGVGGYDAETNTDYYDTLKLLAIQLLDDQDQPIPDVHLTFNDPDGNPHEIPDTPPSPTPTATGLTPTPTTTPTAGGPTTTPTATATPSCASPPCEDCENCIDDDGDGLIDRADPDCAPRANGGGAGLPAGQDVKSLDRCAKAIRKGAAKLASLRLTQLQACLKSLTDCVQLKPGDGGCTAGAQAKCAKIKAALPAAETTIMTSFTKPCTDPPVAASSLDAATGLGYSAEALPCGYRGVNGVGSNLSLAECVRRQQNCAAERLLAVSVPRAGELLVVGGFSLASDLPCLASFADGFGNGVGDASAKALRKCDGAIQKATAKLVSGRRKAIEGCDTPIFTCVETKPGDGKCTSKAQGTCSKSIAGITKLQTAFSDAITKACGAIDINDLRDNQGLGIAALDASCAAIGAPAPTSAADFATCVELNVACRVDQMIDNETPRNQELLGIGTM
ncbi:MAG TPA: hypothetical protein VGK30_12410 [Candidatus Binatia bacterium]|jgi:hypothetical protein